MSGLGDVVRMEIHDSGVVEVILAQPARLNVVDLATRDGLIEAFTAIRDLPDARALLLRAEGKHFSAGADLKEFGSAETIFEARRIRWDRDPWYLLWSLNLPKVAALHGYALGSGLEMSMMCDFRIAAANTMVGLPETKLGMLPAAGGTRSITSWLRPPAALPLVLSGDPIDAAEALRLGLVHTVLGPDEDVDSEARHLARRLAELPPAAAAAAVAAVKASMDLPLSQGLQEEERLSYLTRRFNSA